MSEWKGKDIEQLFRNAAGQQEFEYNEAAWQQMEELLDARKRRRRFFLWWWRALGLLLLSAVMLLAVRQWIEKPKLHNVAAVWKPLDEQPLPKEEKNANTTTETASGMPWHASGKNSQDAPTETASKEEAAGTPSGEGPLTRAKRTQASDYAGPVRLERLSRANEPDDVDWQTKVHFGRERLSGVLLPSLPMPLLLNNAQPLLLPLPPLLPASEEPASNTDRELYLSLLAGGQLTSVGFHDFAQLNAQFGLELEYRLGTRLGLSIGGQYLRLDYRAGEGAYRPPKGFWTRKIAPQSTFGHCKVLEIPLNVNYHWQLNSGAAMRFSAGASSLMVFQQRYYYQYDLPDDDLIRKWKSKQFKSYWFSLATLSVGYELPLTAKTKLTVAPYLQLPLSGVGHGNVRLYAAGIAARFGWKL